MMHSPYAHYIFYDLSRNNHLFQQIKQFSKTFAPSLVGCTENVVPPLIVVESAPVVGVELNVSVDKLISATVDDRFCIRAKHITFTDKIGTDNCKTYNC